MFFTACSRIIDSRNPRHFGTENWRADHERTFSTPVIAYPDVRREKPACGQLFPQDYP